MFARGAGPSRSGFWPALGAPLTGLTGRRHARGPPISLQGDALHQAKGANDDHRAEHYRKPWRSSVDVGPSALWEATGGVAIKYGLHDGALIFTLSRQEATQLQAMIAEQLASKVSYEPWK